MRFVILLILFILFNPNLFSTNMHSVDSNQRKLALGIGNCYLNMIGNDEDGFRRSYYSKLYSVSAYFHRAKFVNVQYCNLAIATKYAEEHLDFNSQMTPGKTLFYYYNLVKLNVGNSFKYENFQFSPYFSFNKRFGFGEEFFVDTISASLWGEYVTSRSEYNSLGIGIGLSVDYVIKNRVTIGVESSYNYNFEKIHPQPGTSINPTDYGFTPSKKSTLFHFKVGYLMF
jgi:hypothetical protein